MESAQLLITFGWLFLIGLAADQIGRITPLPRVTMLLIVGLSAGQSGFRLIPVEVFDWFETLTILALTMVAFLLGGALSKKTLIQHGRSILSISVAIAIGTVLIVSAGLAVSGVDVGLAILLGTIATATAPAAMTDVIRQSGVQNRFTDTLKGIVAIDDVWGLLLFSLAIALIGQSDGWAAMLTGLGQELGGALLLGAGIGIPAAYLTGRLKPGEPQQAEAVGIVFLSAGLALWMEVSFLITGMTVGAIITNLARHHERAFHEIENIQWPFMILFFLLAGASLEPEALLAVGWTGMLFLMLRIIARLLGGAIGVQIGGESKKLAPLYGPALLPQAGVAVGMALVAAEKFPEWASTIMALTIASTVVFELIGPPVTMWAIRKAAGNNGS